MNSEPFVNEFLELSASTATFMSIDVVESTSLKTGENQQDIIYSFLAYHKLVKQAAYTYHGLIMTIAGDGIMLRFERAEDALTAAKTIVTELETLNKRQNRLAHPFLLRLGLHTGEIMENESLSSGQVISSTLDIAAKLQQSAPPNHARISEATALLLKKQPISVQKIGWDAKLQIQVYEYSASGKASVDKRTPPNPVKILLVDQELDEVVKLRKILWARRYDPLPVFTLDQALLAIASWQPHIVFISTELSWDHCWELVGTLRNNPQASGLPIILMARQTTGHVLEKGLKMGVNGVVLKPLEDQPVQKRIDAVMREFYQ